MGGLGSAWARDGECQSGDSAVHLPPVTWSKSRVKLFACRKSCMKVMLTKIEAGNGGNVVYTLWCGELAREK